MILGPLLEMYEDGHRKMSEYDAMLDCLLRKNPDECWIALACEAKEELWQLKLVDHPWRKMLVRDVGHWLRGKLKLEAHRRGHSDWREVRDEYGLGQWDNER